MNAGMNHAIFREHKIRIPTPEQIYLEYPLAGLGRRGLAAAVDSAIIGVMVFTLIVALSLLISGAAAVADSEALDTVMMVSFIVMLALALLSPFLYYFLFEYYSNGQTPGKRLANIRVIRLSGLSLDRTSAALRNLFRVIDMIPSYYLVGVWSTLLTSRQQRVGDVVAGTVVIALPPRGSREAVQTGTAGLSGTASPRGHASNRDQALHWLAYQLMTRRQSLEPSVRSAIALRLASAMGMPQQDADAAEREIWARITNP